MQSCNQFIVVAPNEFLYIIFSEGFSHSKKRRFQCQTKNDYARQGHQRVREDSGRMYLQFLLRCQFSFFLCDKLCHVAYLFLCVFGTQQLDHLLQRFRILIILHRESKEDCRPRLSRNFLKLLDQWYEFTFVPGTQPITYVFIGLCFHYQALYLGEVKFCIFVMAAASQLWKNTKGCPQSSDEYCRPHDATQDAEGTSPKFSLRLVIDINYQYFSLKTDCPFPCLVFQHFGVNLLHY